MTKRGRSETCQKIFRWLHVDTTRTSLMGEHKPIDSCGVGLAALGVMTLVYISFGRCPAEGPNLYIVSATFGHTNYNQGVYQTSPNTRGHGVRTNLEYLFNFGRGNPCNNGQLPFLDKSSQCTIPRKNRTVLATVWHSKLPN